MASWKRRPSGATRYTYDAPGNLRRTVLHEGQPSERVIDYLVDGRNRRIGKKVDGTVARQWVYQDQLRPIAELDGTGTLVAQFVYESKPNVPDYLIKYGTDAGTYRIVSDHLGSPRLVVDVATGDVAQELDYDEFGNATLVTGSWDVQPFGFAGGLYDPDTGLARFGARDYDPQTGRWTAKDPARFAAGSNLFAYVIGDPVNSIDPYGLSRDDIDAAYQWLKTRHPELVPVETFAVGGGVVPYDPWIAEIYLPRFLDLAGIALPGGMIVNSDYESVAWLVNTIAHELQHIDRGILDTMLSETAEEHQAIYDIAEQIRREYEVWRENQERQRQCLP